MPKKKPQTELDLAVLKTLGVRPDKSLTSWLDAGCHREKNGGRFSKTVGTREELFDSAYLLPPDCLPLLASEEGQLCAVLSLQDGAIVEYAIFREEDSFLQPVGSDLATAVLLDWCSWGKKRRGLHHGKWALDFLGLDCKVDDVEAIKKALSPKAHAECYFLLDSLGPDYLQEAAEREPKDLSALVTQLDRLIEQLPELTALHVLRGTALAALEKREEAVTALETALELPRNRGNAGGAAERALKQLGYAGSDEWTQLLISSAGRGGPALKSRVVDFSAKSRDAKERFRLLLTAYFGIVPTGDFEDEDQVRELMKAASAAGLPIATKIIEERYLAWFLNG